jgi:hypothetical protein
LYSLLTSASMVSVSVLISVSPMSLELSCFARFTNIVGNLYFEVKIGRVQRGTVRLIILQVSVTAHLHDLFSQQ